ncbi:DUF397 domain-containing protein [Streptomyces luteireticuli]|uniref:DUF397 domain-containing protein n=1 Tax=Streptomyces luteireticuli TaxID=173858 RepID=A0ABN0Z6R6_9ACTN
MSTERTDLALAAWRKSTYSNAEDEDCVEITDQFPGEVPIRDSKSPDGPAIVVRSAPWAAFVNALATAAIPSG